MELGFELEPPAPKSVLRITCSLSSLSAFESSCSLGLLGLWTLGYTFILTVSMSWTLVTPQPLHPVRARPHDAETLHGRLPASAPSQTTPRLGILCLWGIAHRESHFLSPLLSPWTSGPQSHPDKFPPQCHPGLFPSPPPAPCPLLLGTVTVLGHKAPAPNSPVHATSPSHFRELTATQGPISPPQPSPRQSPCLECSSF